MGKIINGAEISKQILQEVADEIKSFKQIGIPGVAVVQIGNRVDSNVYVSKKCEACKRVGMNSVIHKLDETSTNDDVYKLIELLNTNSEIHGILVQLPLPSHLNEEKILSKISYLKDVDGFHARNIGNLAMEGREPKFVPCTPLGCLELLKREKIEIKGKHAVIVGKSNIVGLPMALILMKELATVSVCHKDTVDIQKHTRMADILVSACGQAEMIKKEWLKEGVVVIDVGLNSIRDPSKTKGYRLVGDIDFNEVKDIASAITPVPGGVGPMTVAMLIKNTLEGFKNTIINNIIE